MKVVLVILLLSISVYGADAITGKADISLGVFGFGFDDDSAHFYGRLLNFRYETYNGFGAGFSPFEFFVNMDDVNDSFFTLVNLSLYYNIFSNRIGYLFLGPFFSMSAVKNSNPKFLEFYSGITFSLRNLTIKGYYPNDSIFSSDFLLIDFGYKYNINNKHGLFVRLGIDVIAAFWLTGSGYAREYEEHQRSRLRF